MPVDPRAERQRAAGVIPRLRSDAAEGARGRAATGAAIVAADGKGPIVLIPPRLRAQGVLDLGLPLSTVVKDFAGELGFASGRPPPGSIIYHDRLDDGTAAAYKTLEVDAPIVVGNTRLVPILVDSASGIWVIRLEAP